MPSVKHIAVIAVVALAMIIVDKKLGLSTKIAGV